MSESSECKFLKLVVGFTETQRNFGVIDTLPTLSKIHDLPIPARFG